jgi:metal-responsive CopG/Arc/MetJ family transcriptional regulator
MLENSDLTEQVIKKDIEDNAPLLEEVDEIAKISNDQDRSERIREFVQTRKAVLEGSSHQQDLRILTNYKLVV